MTKIRRSDKKRKFFWRDWGINEKILFAEAIIAILSLIGNFLIFFQTQESVNETKELYEKIKSSSEKYVNLVNKSSEIEEIQSLLSRAENHINYLKTLNVSNQTIEELEIDYINANKLVAEAISYKIIGNESGYEEAKSSAVKKIQGLIVKPKMIGKLEISALPAVQVIGIMVGVVTVLALIVFILIRFQIVKTKTYIIT